MNLNTATNAKIVQVVAPVSHSTTTSTTYPTAAGVDTKGWRWLTVVLNTGVATGTLDAEVWEDATSTDGAGTLITGAQFTQVTSSNDVAVHVASIDLQGRERYMQLEVAVTTAAVVFGATFILSNAEDSALATDTYVFSV